MKAAEKAEAEKIAAQEDTKRATEATAEAEKKAAD